MREGGRDRRGRGCVRLWSITIAMWMRVLVAKSNVSKRDLPRYNEILWKCDLVSLAKSHNLYRYWPGEGLLGN